MNENLILKNISIFPNLPSLQPYLGSKNQVSYNSFENIKIAIVEY